MPAKRFSVEQIVAKLREAERHEAQGLTIPQSWKRLGISEQTFYRWRIKYGALKEDERSGGRGSPIRILNVVDEYTRVALGSRVAHSIGAGDVIAELERLFERNGRPQVLRSDNGREFIAASLGDWLAERGVKTAFIEKGSPQQNAFVARRSTTCSKPVS